jgi:hypothetical protein
MSGEIGAETGGFHHYVHSARVIVTASEVRSLVKSSDACNWNSFRRSILLYADDLTRSRESNGV